METNLSAFLLSSDLEALLVLKQTFGQYGIQPITCRTASAAPDVLKHKRFDLFVLDFALPGAGELLGQLHSNGTGHAHTVIALTPRTATVEEALRKQVRHVLPKPFTLETATRTLKASYGLIAMEKRAYFRCAVRIGATAFYEENGVKRPLQNAALRDVSQCGLCLKTDIVLQKDTTVFVDFQLPASGAKIHTIGKVMWSDGHGSSGVLFKTVQPEESGQLRAWLNSQCPWSTELSPKAPLQRIPIAMQH